MKKLEHMSFNNLTSHVTFIHEPEFEPRHYGSQITTITTITITVNSVTITTITTFTITITTGLTAILGVKVELEVVKCEDAGKVSLLQAPPAQMAGDRAFLLGASRGIPPKTSEPGQAFAEGSLCWFQASLNIKCCGEMRTWLT